MRAGTESVEQVGAPDAEVVVLGLKDACAQVAQALPVVRVVGDEVGPTVATQVMYNSAGRPSG